MRCALSLESPGGTTLSAAHTPPGLSPRLINVAHRYPEGMPAATVESLALRELLDARRDAVQAVLDRFGAVNPRVFGSVARGDAGPQSDVDLIVDLLPDDRHSDLIRVAGIRVGLREALGREVDVVAPHLLRDRVSRTALEDAIPL